MFVVVGLWNWRTPTHFVDRKITRGLLPQCEMELQRLEVANGQCPQPGAWGGVNGYRWKWNADWEILCNIIGDTGSLNEWVSCHACLMLPVWSFRLKFKYWIFELPSISSFKTNHAEPLWTTASHYELLWFHKGARGFHGHSITGVLLVFSSQHAVRLPSFRARS